MSRLPSMPKPNPKPLVTPKELQDTIKQMKKAGQDTKEMETAHQQLQAASDSYKKALTGSQKAAGAYHGIVVDVCKTPGPPAPFVPIPYPNIAKSKKKTDTEIKKLQTAETNYEKASKTAVKIIDKKTTQLNSEIKKSSGNEAGKLKGIISSMNKDKAKIMQWSSQVKVEGTKIVRHFEIIQKTGDKEFKAIEKQRK